MAGYTVGLSYGWRKSYRAVAGDAAFEPFRAPEQVEVGDGFAHGEVALLEVELAAEQHRHEVGGTQRPGGRVYGGVELRQPCVVMRVELADAQRDTAERQAVRGQHQGVRGQIA